MRVGGDNGCDKLVHVRRAKKPLESQGGGKGGRERERRLRRMAAGVGMS